LEEGGEELLFVAEVVMNEAGGDACLLCDGRDCGSGEAVVCQNSGEGADDFGSACVAIAWSAHTLVV
jgi:hypothetical protein